MADKSEVSVLLTLKDQMTKAMDKAKADVLGSLKTMGVAFTAYAVGMSAALTMAVLDAQNYAVEIDRLNKTTGVSTEEISKLGYAAKQEHASMEALSTGLKFLAKNMYDAKGGTGEAAEAFDKLGIKTADASGNLRNSGTVLLEIADKFKGMTNESEKSALAMKIFGRSGIELIPFLNMGREEIQRLGDEAQRLGIVLSKDNVAAFKKFEDSQDAIKAGFMGIKITIANELLPVLQSLGTMFQGLLEWFNGLSPATKTLITDLVVFSTVWAGLIGSLALVIAYMPQITALFIGLKTVLLGHPVFAIAAALALASAALLDYMTKQQDEQNALIETGKGLQSLITLHQQELIEIKEKLKNIYLSTEAREKLELQYIRTKEAIKDTIAEINKEKKATVDTDKVVGIHVLKHDELAKSITNVGQRLAANRNTMTGAAQATGDYTDGLKENDAALQQAAKDHKNFNDTVNDWVVNKGKNSVKMSNEAAAAWINMTKQILDSGLTIQNTFDVITNGVAQMVGSTNPVLGAVIQLGGSLIEKLFWGKKAAKPKEMIDENMKIINDYLESVRLKWADFAIDLSQALAEALKMPDITAGWGSLLSKMTSMFQSQLANQLSLSILKSPVVQDLLASITGNISYLGTLGKKKAEGINVDDAIENTKIWLESNINELMGVLKPMWGVLGGIFNNIDWGIPAMAEGGKILPRPGGTIVRVGEARETEYVIPESKMGGGDTYHISFSGIFTADKTAMAKLAREYLIPELTRYKLKTGEAF